MDDYIRALVISVSVFVLLLTSCALASRRVDANAQARRVAAEFERRILAGQDQIVRLSEVAQNSGIRVVWRIDSSITWTMLSNAIATRLRPEFRLLRSDTSSMVFVKDAHGDEWSVVVSRLPDDDHGVTLELTVYPD